MEKEFVSFTLEGDSTLYKLCYDFNEVCDAETITGCNLLRAMADLRSISATQVRALLYACLKTAHPAVLLNEAGDLMSRDFATVSQALAKALGAGDEEEIPEPAPTAAAPSTATAEA